MKNLKKGDLVKIASEKKLKKAGYDNENGFVDMIAGSFGIVKEVIDNCDDCRDKESCVDAEEPIVYVDIYTNSEEIVEYPLSKGLMKKMPEVRVGDKVLLKSTKKVLKTNGYNSTEVLISMESDLNRLVTPNIATVREVLVKEISDINAFGVVFEESEYLYELDSIEAVLPKVGDFIVVENEDFKEVVAIVSDIDEEYLSVYCYGEFEEEFVTEFEVLVEDIIDHVRKEDL